MSGQYLLLSESKRHDVTTCPKCSSSDIRGPHDTGRSAQFLFTRAWFCRTCWWDREVRMKDDIAEAKANEEKKKEKDDAYAKRRGRISA